MAKSIAILAMVYYLFITINGLVYVSIIGMNTFFAVLGRISGVVKLDEYSKQDSVSYDENGDSAAHIKVENANYGWGFRLNKVAQGSRIHKLQTQEEDEEDVI